MAVEIHRVNVGLFYVIGGNVIHKTDPGTTLSMIATADQEYRVMPNTDGPVSTANSADYPDVDAYLQLEADSDFALAYRDHYEIITQKIT